MLFRKISILLIVTISLLSLSFGQSVVHADDVKAIPVLAQIYDFKLSPNGRIVAIFENPAIHDNKPVSQFLPIRLIDLSTGKEAATLTTTDYAYGVAFSPDSRKLAS